jgi:hypothetical protein
MSDDTKQEAIELVERQPAGATLWQLWVLATTVSWSIVGALIGAVDFAATDPRLYLFLPLVGVGQWLVLRLRFARASLWLLATTGGVAAAAVAYVVIQALPESLLGPPASGVRAGLSSFADGVALAVAQWLVLRGTVRGAARWIPATMAPLWFFGALALSQGTQAVEAPLDLTASERVQLSAINAGVQGLGLGAMTGLALIQLARDPKRAAGSS